MVPKFIRTIPNESALLRLCIYFISLINIYMNIGCTPCILRCERFSSFLAHVSSGSGCVNCIRSILFRQSRMQPHASSLLYNCHIHPLHHTILLRCVWYYILSFDPIQNTKLFKFLATIFPSIVRP